MPVDTFTKEQFEAALPQSHGMPLARSFAFENGQWVYTMPVLADAMKVPDAATMAIKVYSGIGASGVSAECGEDSIRAVIVRESDGKVYGSKLKRWVTRQPGWRVRMTDMLREMWKLALLTGPCACGGCVGVYLVKKAGPSKGRMFRKCDNDACREDHGRKPLFEWLVVDDKGALRKEAA
jgi:hypothetical protein